LREKTFAPGDRVMVWHAMLPKNVNPKFYKKWRYAKIVKMMGRSMCKCWTRMTGRSLTSFSQQGGHGDVTADQGGL
jgi:hypothetical protein